MPERTLEPLANYHCRCGENPLWDGRTGLVYWTDIPAGLLFRYNPATGAHECFYRGAVVGGFTLQEDDSLLLFGENRFWTLDPDGRERTIAEGVDDGMTRFNDVIAAPDGGVFAGTMGKTKESGGVIRIDPDGSSRCLWRGTGCANGMGFSPDRRTFYWTCSTTRRIFAFDFDAATGELTGRRLWKQFAAEEKIPDGMTVDAGGHIWSARWDGFGLFHYAADGELIEKIAFPVAKVSSAIFGGPNMDELYVTTAGGAGMGEPSDKPDGTLYRVKVAARGLPEFRSRVGLQ